MSPSGCRPRSGIHRRRHVDALLRVEIDEEDRVAPVLDEDPKQPFVSRLARSVAGGREAGEVRASIGRYFDRGEPGAQMQLHYGSPELAGLGRGSAGWGDRRSGRRATRAGTTPPVPF
jgi:hypothetical protein